eukprot:TRINITY_DN28302_c0_g1_i1.p1 TRINITY_DN28302_c0_g1~~TRINITY_DN28302_c0_g1_i1.p1  ORF type:complete len:685 (-),score=132.71 TRINITY_DN28302_c0_g1_i1:134-2188(-)
MTVTAVRVLGVVALFSVLITVQGDTAAEGHRPMLYRRTNVGPFDNWNVGGFALLSCDGLRLDLPPTIQLSKPAYDWLHENSPYRRRKKKRSGITVGKVANLNLWCASARQDTSTPRCFSDYSRYQRVATISLASRHYHHSLPVTQHETTFRGALRGQNAAVCFLAYDKYKQAEHARKHMIGSLRFNVLQGLYETSPSGQHVKAGDNKADVKKDVIAPIRSIRDGLYRTYDYEYKPTKDGEGPRYDKRDHQKSAGYIERLNAGLANTPGKRALMHKSLPVLRATLQKKELLSIPSPLMDTMMGSIIGYIPKSSLVCLKYFTESLPLSNQVRPHRDGFNPYQLQEKKDKFNKCPLILAHRTVIAGSASEGSLINAHRIAKEDMADGIEIDLFAVKSGSGETNLVVSHDADLDRIIGYPGKIASLFKSQTVGLLEETSGCQLMTPLEKFLDIGLQHPHFSYDLELKPGNPLANPFGGYNKAMGHALGKLLRSKKYAPLLERDQIVVSSFDSGKTKNVNRGFSGPPVRTARAAHNTVVAKILHAIVNNPVTRDKQAKGVIMHHSMLNKRRVDKLHEKGYAVGTYTLYDQTRSADDPSHSREEIRRLFDLGVDWMETDDPRALRAALTQYASDICPAVVGDIHHTPSYRSIYGEPAPVLPKRDELKQRDSQGNEIRDHYDAWIPSRRIG